MKTEGRSLTLPYFSKAATIHRDGHRQPRHTLGGSLGEVGQDLALQSRKNKKRKIDDTHRV